jgi:hypothetical protein
MERNQSEDTRKPLYRKRPGTGGLRLRKPSRRIKPGEFIRITPEELGKFITEFELVEDVKKTSSVELVEKNGKKKDRFLVVPRSAGWFDVMDSLTNKGINEKGYRQNEAEKYARELNEGNQTSLTRG